MTTYRTARRDRVIARTNQVREGAENYDGGLMGSIFVAIVMTVAVVVCAWIAAAMHPEPGEVPGPAQAAEVAP